MNNRSKVAALLGTAAVLAALIWVAQAVVHHNALQNCIDSGRRDCVEAAAP